MRTNVVAMLLMLTGCEDIPLDPEETMQRVEASKVLRVGVVASGDPGPDRQQRRFLASVTSETHSRLLIMTEPAELLLPKREEGRLNVVVGRFAAATPWEKRVTLLPDPRRRKEDRKAISSLAAVRNEENRWIALVHRHASILEGEAR